MSIRMNPTVRQLKPTIPRDPPREFSSISYCDFLVARFRASSSSSASRPLFGSRKFDETVGRIAPLNARGGEGSLQELDDSPVSVELAPISSESQFDRVIAEAQQLEESVIVVWYVSGFFGISFKFFFFFLFQFIFYFAMKNCGKKIIYFSLVGISSSSSGLWSIKFCMDNKSKIVVQVWVM